MKFLDEKGRLFGKVNLVDLAVILVIVFAVCAVAWKMIGPQVTEAVESIAPVPTVTYEVVCYNINPEAAAYAETQIDTQMMNSGNLLDAYLRDCTVVDRMDIAIDAEGNHTEFANPNYKVVTFVVEAHTALVGNAYAIGTQELRVGKSHVVKTNNIEMTGTITALEVTND